MGTTRSGNAVINPAGVTLLASLASGITSVESTFTAPRSEVAKNGIGWKRNTFAMRLSGKDSIRVTYCFTEVRRLEPT